MGKGSVFYWANYRDQIKMNIFKLPIVFFKDIKYCWQRMHKGYCDRDLWSIYDWFLDLMPEMLTEYKNTRHGSPYCLELEEKGEDEEKNSEDCHAKWNKILDQMIFLLGEANEATCQKKNPLEDKHERIYEEFEAKYGEWGEKLNKVDDKKSNSSQFHSPSELPEYKEFEEAYYEEDRKLDEYREQCKDQAFELFSKWFYCLWD